MSDTWTESAVTLIGEGCSFEGKIELDGSCRVHGLIRGELHAKPGSRVILAESSSVEGDIQADELVIDGFVRGDIRTAGRLTISRTGRVIGNIRSASFRVEPGGYFEGQCSSGKTQAVTGIESQAHPESGFL